MLVYGFLRELWPREEWEWLVFYPGVVAVGAGWGVVVGGCGCVGRWSCGVVE